MLDSSAEMIPVLELFRAQLQRAIEPIDISPYREELVRDLAALKCCEEDLLASTLANHIACLKETQKKVLQLEQGCKDSKTLENKMQYSIEVKEISGKENRIQSVERLQVMIRMS
jgi:hypothetical protein